MASILAKSSQALLLASSRRSSRLTLQAQATRLLSLSSSTGTKMTEGINNNEYWNRENSESFLSSLKDQTVKKEARIVSLSPPNDPNNFPLEKDELMNGASLLGVGSTVDELDVEKLKQEKANVLFVSPGVSSATLASLMDELQDSLEWIHSRSAGIDVLMSSTLSDPKNDHVIMTNAKGTFSSTLAEYTMLACSYFAKDLPQLMKNKQNSKWKKYPILELRGATLGVAGYGDIGKAAAKLAKAYGMKVIALRRTVPANKNEDPYCDVVYDQSSLNKLFQESDYVLCSLPLTKATHKMIGKEQFDNAKDGCVFINVGRGPIVDESELIDALKDGRLKGAGLDVFTNEPLEKESGLWTLENVLLSPHNMDMTDTFRLESTQFFVQENLPRFVYGHSLLNPVDKKAGY